MDLFLLSKLIWGLSSLSSKLYDRHPTGTVDVTFDSQQNPDFFIVPDVAYDFIEMTSEMESLAGEADCICFGTLIQRCEVSRQALQQILTRAEKALKLLDINLRKACWTVETVRGSLEAAQILKLNEWEIFDLGRILRMELLPLPQLSAKVLERFCLEYLLVTLGGKGVFGVSARGDRVYVPGYRVDVVDSLGSGDAFTAGFLYALLNDGDFATACELGNILGALVATTPGATTPITLAEIASFNEKNRDRISDPEFR